MKAIQRPSGVLLTIQYIPQESKLSQGQLSCVLTGTRYILECMRKIDTWLFLAFFIASYIGIFFAASVAIGFAVPHSFMLAHPNVMVAIFLVLLALSYLATAFGLRSYYELPASPAKLVGIMVAIQLALQIATIVVQPEEAQTFFQIAIQVFLDMLVLSAGTFISLFLADRYFKNKALS
jgi:hypothetical protein